MSVIDDLVANNRSYAESFERHAPRLPAQLAVIACMDARIDVFRVLGLTPGQAHVIRNAGGVITDDEIRSLAISQRVLGTRSVMLIHHTRCNMMAIDDGEFRDAIEADTGTRPPWSTEAFADLAGNVRESIARVTTSSFVPHTDDVRGFIYDVDTGLLEEVR